MTTAIIEPANGRPSGRAGAAMSAARERWMAMPLSQRRLLLLCGAALLGLSVISGWWSTRTDWRTLFSGLDGRDAATMQQQLSAAGITYQATPDGTSLQVPAEQLDKARVAISAGGLPQSGRLGFELFDKPNWIGSEFDEKVNYQRALEGELEHTISSLSSVRSARVHIVLPKQGAFASEDQPAKASAVLKLLHANLPRQQSEAIRNLIAGSVENLRPEAVTLVDADGHADMSPGSRSGQDREIEVALQSKLTQMLEPLAGNGNVHATVSVSYLQTSEEHTDEVYDPKSATAVSTQRTEQSSQNTRQASVAGAAGNTPAVQPATVSTTPAVPGASGAAASSASAPTGLGQAQTSREESSSFAVNRHITHTEEAPGRIRRLTAAIVVNDREIHQMSGRVQHTAWQHRSADEMRQLQQLAQAAVGYDEERGDQVVLENIAFSGNTDPIAATGLARVTDGAQDLLRTQPALLRTLGSLLGILVLGMMVLRPLTRQTQQLLTAAPRPQLLTASASAPSTTDATAAQPLAPGAALNTQQIFDRVSEQIKTEPQGGTRVIGSWISAGSEEAD